MSYLCTTCGEFHEGDAWNFAADFPDMYANMTAEEREDRAQISSDQCIIDSEIFCIRGNLEIPILGSDDVFSWGVWARVNEKAFDEIHESWTQAGRENVVGPFRGRLVNSLPTYEIDTFNLTISIRIQEVGVRPLFMATDVNHPLFKQQHDWITIAEANELNSRLLHQP